MSADLIAGHSLTVRRDERLNLPLGSRVDPEDLAPNRRGEYCEYYFLRKLFYISNFSLNC